MKCNESKLFHKSDLLICLAVLALAGAAALCLQGYRMTHPAGAAVITIDGEVVKTCDLALEQEFDLDTGYGRNHVRIQDGEVFVSEADCPDHNCVRQGRISAGGESIICLPHHLCITVQNTGRQAQADTISR